MAREKFPSDDVDRLMIRFPKGMRERIRDTAELNGRSMNGEIVAALARAFPSSVTAFELMSELYSFLHFHKKKFDDTEQAVLSELLDALGDEVKRLQKFESAREADNNG